MKKAVHGGVGSLYSRGCRCEPCRVAHRQRQQRSFEQRCAERIMGENGRWFAPRPQLPHGKLTTYTNWGCRCAPCTEAQRLAAAEHRRRKKAT